MPMKVKKPESNIPPIPAKTYQAVCFAIVDLGTQYSEVFNSSSRKVLFCWEIPSLQLKTKDKSGEEISSARVASKQYTFSLGKRASLRKDLTTWRGVEFTESELDSGFDIFKMAGSNCLLQIIHTKKGEKVYANVAGVMSLPDGMKPVKAENPILTFCMDDEGTEPPNNVPSWVKDTIRKSQEYQAAHSQDAVADDEDEQFGEPFEPEDIPI